MQGNLRTSATEVAAHAGRPAEPARFERGGPHHVSGLGPALATLQLLFEAIDLPIRPSYWDFQFKTTTRLSAKTTLTTLGLGAIDKFRLGVPPQRYPGNRAGAAPEPHRRPVELHRGREPAAPRPQRLPERGPEPHPALITKLDQFQAGAQDDESRRILLTRSARPKPSCGPT
ncbi:MAG: hypothetical protein WKG07_44755 [Hymenobacter sp.]